MPGHGPSVLWSPLLLCRVQGHGSYCFRPRRRAPPKCLPAADRPAKSRCQTSARACHSRYLHHTCTTTEWHLRSRTVNIGHSEMAVELPKPTNVLLTAVHLHTFAS